MAFAHAGEHHNSSCFLTVGDTKLRLNGYYLDNQFVGKHFCRIYPTTGQILLAIDVLDDTKQNQQLGLALSTLAPWSEWPRQLFKPIKQQPAKQIGTGLLALPQTIVEPALYAFDISLVDAAGNQQSKRIFLAAGIPVTKLLVYFAGLLLLVIAFAWLKSLRGAQPSQ